MTPRSLALVAAALLVFPSALAQTEEEVIPPSSYAIVDGVKYYLLAGTLNVSALSYDSGGGDTPIAFQGCAFVQLRPELDRGRVSIAGLIDGFTPMRIEVGDFTGNLAGQGPIATNITVGPALHPLLPAGTTVDAEVAAEAGAIMQASEFIDYTRTPPAFVLANFTDPVGGGEDLRARLVVAQDGLRDDETAAVQDEPTEADDELHVVIGSPVGVAPAGDRFGFLSPADLPDGSLSADAEHAMTYEFLNSRFGGTGKLTFSATSKAPPGFNSVTVAVRAPDGTEVGNATVDWDLLAAGSATIEFPADQMGFYTLVVMGKVMMASYTLDVELAPPALFQLDFWWEDVVRGAPASNAYGECQREIGLRAQVVAGKVDRSEPPTFPLKVVILSIVAAAIVALLVIKMASDQLSASAFRKLKK